MKFCVTRTSEGFDEEKRPCDESEKVVIPKKGNYLEHTEWVVEINTIEELMAFCKKYGDIIISEQSCEMKFNEIEIYDDYRE